MLTKIVPKYAFIKKKMRIGEVDEEEMKEKDEDENEDMD